MQKSRDTKNQGNRASVAYNHLLSPRAKGIQAMASVEKIIVTVFCVTTVVTLLLASVFVAHLKGYGMPFVAKRPGLLRQGLVILHDKGGPLTPNMACDCFRRPGDCGRLPDLAPTELDALRSS